MYSLEDVYLMGLAHELSEAGMAAGAIGELVEATKAKIRNGLGSVDTLFIWRDRRHGYRIETQRDRVPVEAVVKLVVDVAGLRARVDREAAKLR